MARNRWKLDGMAGNRCNGWKCLKMAKCGCRQLELAGNGWNWLEKHDIAGNGWKRLEIAGHDLIG